MKRIHIRVLSDEELRPELKAGDSIFFLGRRPKLLAIEQQVDRLGFGELYIVSMTQGPNADRVKIRLNPVQSSHQVDQCLRAA